MKPVALMDVRTEGSLGDDTTKIKMGVDQDNIDHLLMLLTDLYSDQVMAVIREYSTNARDAHLDSGVSRPIEVTLPNGMSSIFKVRDYGRGLSLEDITKVYSQYGSSTKRGENVSNGMFGIDCKSALTYTSQFTVTSVCNGERMVVVVSRAGTDASMEVVSRKPSSEPSGVEVSVPVKYGDANSFQNKAKHFFSFWDQGTVLVNGVEPARISLDMVTDTIGTTTGLESDYIVMGGVAYPCEDRLFGGRSWGSRFNIVAFVPVGSVSIPPSREMLMYTKHTNAVVEVIKKEFSDKIRQKIIDDINDAPTHHEAITRRDKWAAAYRTLMPAKATYKGVQIPDTFTFNYARWNSVSYRHSFGSNYNDIDLNSLINSVVVYDWPHLASLSATHKAKINQWKDKAGINTRLVVFTDKPEGDPWIDPARVVSWNTIKAEVLPKTTSTPNPNRKPTLNVYDKSGYERAVELDKTKRKVYVSPRERVAYTYIAMLYTIYPDIEIVSLGENRWEKFKRDHANAVHLNDFVKAEYKSARDALTPNDIKFLGMRDSEKATLTHLDETKIDDQEFAQGIMLAKGTLKSAAVEKFLTIAKVSMGLSMGIHSSLPHVSFIKNYPLLNTYESGTLVTDHKILYINAVYKAASN